MTRQAAHTHRRRRRCPRRCTLALGSAKALLGIALAIALVLSPWEPLLPEATPQLGTPPAAAQAAVVSGTPDRCPSGWTEAAGDDSLCVLTQRACPESPLKLDGLSARTMTISTEFHDFCEDTVLHSESEPLYDACIETQHPALTGFAIKLHDDGVDPSCRAIVPTECAPGLHRVSLENCRQYVRRTWVCRENYIARNEFNTCYLPQTASPDRACEAVGSQFTLFDCATYVGEDLVQPPVRPTCKRAFKIGNAYKFKGAGNKFWCKYDASWLRLECHADGASCQTTDALCIRRASKTGGCDAVLHTIKCHKLHQAADTDAEDLQQAGCTPCPILPFSPVDRTACRAEEYARTANTNLSELHQYGHLVKDDFAYETCVGLQNELKNGSFEQATFDTCAKQPKCLDPPHGAVRWHSAHPSGLAMINVPVIVESTDLVIQEKTLLYPRPDYGQYLQYNQLHGDGQKLLGLITTQETNALIVGSNSSEAAAHAPASWGEVNTDSKYDSISLMMSNGQCTLASRPSFRLVVEEMWPDEDSQDMLRLFGAQALEWWPTERAQQERISAERGFRLTTGLSPEEQQQERERRELERSSEIGCHSDTESWCRWTPQHAGYFRLTVAGAWTMSKWNTSRNWRINHDQTDVPARVNKWLSELTQDMSVPCDSDLDHNDRHWFHRGCILKMIATASGVAISEVSPANLASFGLNEDLTGLLPIPPASDEFYQIPRPCPTQDLRVQCGSPDDAVNYTETEPIGIVVHEARVVTRRAGTP